MNAKSQIVLDIKLDHTWVIRLHTYKVTLTWIDFLTIKTVTSLPISPIQKSKQFVKVAVFRLGPERIRFSYLLFRWLAASPPQKKPKTTTGPVGIFPEEQNQISSVVTEILRDRRTEGQTDRHHSTLYYRSDLNKDDNIHKQRSINN